MDDHQVHTIPNYVPSSKMDVLTKTFVQIILAAKQLVRHSRTSLNQQRRPLPSPLSLSLFYDQIPHFQPFEKWNLWKLAGLEPPRISVLKGV